MSDGGGGVLGGVLVAGALYWIGVALALPVGLGLIADALLVVWTVGVVGASALFAAILLVAYARAAVSERNWLWLADLFVAPTVAMWVGWTLREGFRGYWVDFTHSANGSAGSQLLAGGFMFVFFLASIPLSIWALGRWPDKGLEGSVRRVLVGYLPMVFAVGSWVALVANSVDPVPVEPPAVAALQATCKDRATGVADNLVEEAGKEISGKTMRLHAISVGDPRGWDWRGQRATITATVDFEWWVAGQSAPIGYATQKWACQAHWNANRTAWTIDRMHYNAD